MAKSKKLNISLNEELLERVDEYSEQMSISRSGLISLALSQYLSAQEVMTLLRGMNIAMQRIADKGMVDEETMKQLEEFEVVCKALTGK